MIRFAFACLLRTGKTTYDLPGPLKWVSGRRNRA